MPQAKIGEHSVHYLEVATDTKHGSMLFIHGAGGEGAIWSNLLAKLPDGFSGVAPDLPGHHQSDGDPSSSVKDYATVLISLLTILDLPRPLVLVGHSMGGAIALTIALSNPGLIDGLVLIGSGARLQVAPQFLTALEAGIMDGNFLGLGFANSTPEAIKKIFLAQAADIPVLTFFKDFSACSSFDVRDQIRQLHLPLLLLVGDEDRLTPLKLSNYIKEQVAGAHLIVIPAAGHFAMLEQPAAISAALSEFVAQLE